MLTLTRPYFLFPGKLHQEPDAVTMVMVDPASCISSLRSETQKWSKSITLGSRIDVDCHGHLQSTIRDIEEEEDVTKNKSEG